MREKSGTQKVAYSLLNLVRFKIVLVVDHDVVRRSHSALKAGVGLKIKVVVDYRCHAFVENLMRGFSKTHALT